MFVYVRVFVSRFGQEGLLGIGKRVGMFRTDLGTPLDRRREQLLEIMK